MFYEGFEYKHIIQSKSYGPYGGGGNVFVLNKFLATTIPITIPACRHHKIIHKLWNR